MMTPSRWEAASTPACPPTRAAAHQKSTSPAISHPLLFSIITKSSHIITHHHTIITEAGRTICHSAPDFRPCDIPRPEAKGNKLIRLSFFFR